MKRILDERGSVLVLTAVWLSLLLGFLGFATDVGTMLIQRRMAQTAADAAALAGVEEINWATSDNTTVTAKAQAAAAANGFTNGSNGVTVTVNNPPTSGPHTGSSSFIEVIVQRAVPTFFLNVLNQSTMTVSARAVSGYGGSQGCVYTLGTSGTDIHVGGNANINLPGCDLWVNSSSSTAISGNGNASISAGEIGIVGNYSVPGGISPTPLTGMTVAADPLAYLPAPTVPGGCTTSLGSGSATYGCYSGISLNNGTLSLGPGLYVINGNISIGGNANVTGSGVTLYCTGSASIGGGGTLNISAPTTGTYAGILYFQSRTDSSTISFSGGGGGTIEGIFYAPDAAISMGGNSSGNIYASFVVSSMSLQGTPNLQSYGLINGSNPLATPTLEE